MDYSEYTKKVNDCMNEINQAIDTNKINSRNKTKNRKLIQSIIKEKTKAYGLKSANIEIIFFGLNITRKPKLKKFNNFNI